MLQSLCQLIFSNKFSFNHCLYVCVTFALFIHPSSAKLDKYSKEPFPIEFYNCRLPDVMLHLNCQCLQTEAILGIKIAHAMSI